jgi:hypothetical protein
LVAFAEGWRGFGLFAGTRGQVGVQRELGRRRTFGTECALEGRRNAHIHASRSPTALDTAVQIAHELEEALALASLPLGFGVEEARTCVVSRFAVVIEYPAVVSCVHQSRHSL